MRILSNIDIVISAEDQYGGGVTDTFNLDVYNNAPTVANAIADQETTEDVLWEFTIPANTFTDDPEDSLAITVSLDDNSSLPGWLSFNDDTGVLSGTPTDSADMNIKVTATDKFLFDFR